MVIDLSGYYSLILAAVIMLVGHALVFRIKFLSNYNIPEPVAGGLLAVVLLFIINLVFGWSFTFDADLQKTFMLMFFASIGLSADFVRLKEGGKPLVMFVAVVAVFVVAQNIVGVGLSSALGLHPLMGLVTGSISLTGGHGTAAAWGPLLESKYGVIGATTVGVAVATVGLVIGGMIGGPVARYLLKRQGQQPLPETEVRTTQQAVSGEPRKQGESQEDTDVQLTFDRFDQPRRINAYSAIQTLAMFAACLVASELMMKFTRDTWLELPQFIWALGCGVVIRNILTHAFSFKMFDRAIDVFGSASLSLFLVMALLTLRLWELADLAGPVLIMVAVQTVFMVFFAIFVTYRFMGKNYDGIVLSAGHCGFGVGATPTAIANMQAITDRYGPSYKAYLIVPLVGAFFVDLINAAVLQTFVAMFG